MKVSTSVSVAQVLTSNLDAVQQAEGLLFHFFPLRKIFDGVFSND